MQRMIKTDLRVSSDKDPALAFIVSTIAENVKRTGKK